MNVWSKYLEEKYQGPILECEEVLLSGRNKVDWDSIFTPKEKKKLKPTQDMMDLYCESNSEADSIIKKLEKKYGRDIHQLKINGDSLFEAIMFQISTGANNFNAMDLRKQIAFYMIRWPEVFKPLLIEAKLLDKEYFKSYMMNLYYRKKFGRSELLKCSCLNVKYCYKCCEPEIFHIKFTVNP